MDEGLTMTTTTGATMTTTTTTERERKALEELLERTEERRRHLESLLPTEAQRGEAVRVMRADYDVRVAGAEGSAPGRSSVRRAQAVLAVDGRIRRELEELNQGAAELEGLLAPTADERLCAELDRMRAAAGECADCRTVAGVLFRCATHEVERARLFAERDAGAR
jgi:hypothetical protein